MFLPEEHEVGLKDVPKMFLVRLLATKLSLMLLCLPEVHKVGLKDVPKIFLVRFLMLYNPGEAVGHKVVPNVLT
jgi:hypothetical protein